MGVHFAHFGVELGVVFGELRSVRTYLPFQFQMSKKEKEICKLGMGLKNFFVRALI